MENNKMIKYIGGWEIYFDSKESAIDILLTHGVDVSGFNFFKNVQSALEFEMEGNKLIKGYQHNKDKKVLTYENIDLPISEWNEHTVFLMEKDPEGTHHIGGKIPDNLTIPKHPEQTTPFQYIGTLNGRDPYFQWLGLDYLHIVFPLEELNEGVFLDYSNPEEPIVIEPIIVHADAFENYSYNLELSQVKYKTTNLLSVHKFNAGEALLGGVPLWYQFPRIPKCPITTEPMKFVCSIKSDNTINVVKKQNNVVVENNSLSLGDGSHLMLFFNPDKKILFAHIEP
ncbi:hypothetical protein [Bacillus alkalicellulosilyticus]|uniref:hypothetical protein n=1 Tax=Alkalihalobacterium alkalicellulosilyticum TaxID=1912214 RepID=UPI000998D14C|nr:hypothetical protein [Bacillus alkalicellulosilyticus]